MANWISYIKDDLGTGSTTRDGMISDGPTHGVQLSQELPPLVGFTTIGSSGTLHVAGTIKLDGQLKDGDNAFGSSGQVLSSDGTDTKWVNAGSLSAGAASQVAINDDSNANASRFLTFVDSSSGNNSVKTDPQLTYNPSTNVISTSGIDVSDNSEIRFGGGNDLKISHTNSLASQNDSAGNAILAGDTWASYINETGSGPLIFKSNGGPSTGAFQFYDTGWRPILKLFSGTNARAALYHAGSEKLVTSSTGLTVTGTVAATGFSGALTGNVTGNVSGNAGTATKLATARNIGGVSFDGSAAINLPGVNQAGNQNTSGNAATATTLETTRSFSITGDITANAVNFNGSGNVTLSATIDDNAVDKACMANEAVGEAELHISNSGTNGQFLAKRSGNAGGLTWETVAAANAGTLQGSTLTSGVTASSLTSLGTLTGLTVNGTINVINGETIELKTSSGNIRGYIQATETNDAHLIIATSGGEDISFRDGGTGGGVNMRIRGDGNVFITGNCTADSFTGDLDASWITSGTLPSADRVPNLPASKITSGTIADARLSSSSLFVSGMIMMWSGSTGSIPSGWVLCNGSNSTPDLRNRFVVGAGNNYSVDATGGSDTVSLTTSNLPSHTHSFSGSGSASHSHTINNHTHSWSGNTNTTGNHNHHESGGSGYNHEDSERGWARTTGDHGDFNHATDGNHSHSISGTTGNPSNRGTDSKSVSISISGTTGGTGSGIGHENRPPYYALCFIMKT